jgi:glucosamine 6-phosphate synthetase-like amidotransferase/phosphosugar isomerase protein
VAFSFFGTSCTSFQQTTTVATDDLYYTPNKKVETAEKLAAIEKGGYEHFMIKEIFEQPSTIFDCLRGRLDAKEGLIKMSGVDENIEQIINPNFNNHILEK